VIDGNFFITQIMSLLETYGSIGLVSRKMKQKNIADFHVLGLFMAKKIRCVSLACVNLPHIGNREGMI
jgi:hypothetical protein